MRDVIILDNTFCLTGVYELYVYDKQCNSFLASWALCDFVYKMIGIKFHDSRIDRIEWASVLMTWMLVFVYCCIWVPKLPATIIR